MADLTSTIKITGTINGRKIDFEHTYTITDVYDAGTHIATQLNNDASFAAEDAAGTGVWGYLQDTPNYMLFKNDSRQWPQIFELGTNGQDCAISVPPQGFALLAATTGCCNLTNAAGNTTLLDVEQITTGNGYATGAGLGVPTIYLAFNAVS